MGNIVRVSGPVVEAENLLGTSMYEVCRVGEEELIGEIIRLLGDVATIQVYEETAGLKPGETVIPTGEPLCVELGPGLIGQIFDGIQRPLPALVAEVGEFIRRGIVPSPLDHTKRWAFIPKVHVGDPIGPGDILGEVKESTLVTHRVLTPPLITPGKVKSVVEEGEYTIDEDICIYMSNGEEKPFKMFHIWPVRTPRPITQKLPSSVPLITGQRIFDTFVPIAKGGTGAIPGAFGTGKTVMQHQLAKWSDAKVVVYVGCGERGNEMAEVLLEFPRLEDPRSGEPLMNRTVLIANTSNMPVAAREASVYTGITLAEYYRDQGYNVALMADSTSRWAEAIREVSGRLEEMPGEEGYPAYLGSKVAEFYERSGRIKTVGSPERIGSITVIGAVSPPGGDFSEPVTQSTLRVVKVFYALSKDLASRRHFPAIDWLNSYSLYLEDLEPWFVDNVASDFISLRRESMAILQKEKELQEIVQLVGPDALPESERIVLEAARMLREDYLMQNSYSEDSFCPLDKQYKMLNAILKFYHKMQELQDKGIMVRDLTGIPLFDKVSRMKWYLGEEFERRLEVIMKDIQELSPETLTEKPIST
ncbi:MAG: V-type ATP synthase subunit A [Candidatus Heimdallarchaeota archaeon]